MSHTLELVPTTVLCRRRAAVPSGAGGKGRKHSHPVSRSGSPEAAACCNAHRHPPGQPGRRGELRCIAAPSFDPSDPPSYWALTKRPEDRGPQADSRYFFCFQSVCMCASKRAAFASLLPDRAGVKVRRAHGKLQNHCCFPPPTRPSCISATASRITHRPTRLFVFHCPLSLSPPPRPIAAPDPGPNALSRDCQFQISLASLLHPIPSQRRLVISRCLPAHYFACTFPRFPLGLTPR